MIGHYCYLGLLEIRAFHHGMPMTDLNLNKATIMSVFHHNNEVTCMIVCVLHSCRLMDNSIHNVPFKEVFHSFYRTHSVH